MSLASNLRERIRINSITRVKRSLLGYGKLDAKLNQQVVPSDIIGEYQQTPGYLSINLAKALGISTSQGEKYLQKRFGEKIFKGELLAQKMGLLNKKDVTSPTDGVIDGYNLQTGELRMKYLPKQIQLTSGVYGIIDQISGNDVYIKTVATEIFGICGSGKQRSGILKIIDGKENLMSGTQLKRDMSSHILVCGALVYKEALRKAIDYGVAGLIVGGLDASDFLAITGSINPTDSTISKITRMGTDIGISVIATEGFGPIPMGDDLFTQLRKYEDKYVFITGNSSRIVLPVLNPNIIMTLKNIVLPPSIKEPERQPEIIIKDIKVGVKVRLIWPPYVGAQGKVVEIDKQPTTLPSGVSTYMLTVETSIRKFKVPFLNVELIVIN